MKYLTMNINWPVLIIVGVVLAALVIFLIVRNRKDEKVLEQELNEDYSKPKEDEHTDDPDDLKSN
jgi:protein-S-isoprenylcysteine O-methyltransferase Ste14